MVPRDGAERQLPRDPDGVEGLQHRGERVGEGDPAALRTALDEVQGQLVPEEGTAEWAVTARAEIDADVTSAAVQLADLWIDGGEPATAVAVCQAGLRVDRYCDPLWRSLLRALQLDHDHAGHALAVAQYDAVLADLGVQAAPTGT